MQKRVKLNSPLCKFVTCEIYILHAHLSLCNKYIYHPMLITDSVHFCKIIIKKRSYIRHAINLTCHTETFLLQSPAAQILYFQNQDCVDPVWKIRVLYTVISCLG